MFTLGSFLSFLSPNFSILLIGRILEAIGTGVLMPVPQILIFKVLPPNKWNLYMGLFGFIIGILPALGPTIGGMLSDTVGWKIIFLLFTVGSLFLLIISNVFIKFSLETEDYPLDAISLILSIVAYAGIMAGFTNIAEYDFSLIYVILPIIIGIISLIIFLNRQKRIENPLINLKVLKNSYILYGVQFLHQYYTLQCVD